jgi:hypothetical protein
MRSRLLVRPASAEDAYCCDPGYVRNTPWLTIKINNFLLAACWEHARHIHHQVARRARCVGVIHPKSAGPGQPSSCEIRAHCSARLEHCLARSRVGTRLRNSGRWLGLKSDQHYSEAACPPAQQLIMPHGSAFAIQIGS